MPKEPKKLHKQLGAFDVFSIATGAMFSSGLFLLPGIAAGETGPSVFLAYLVSGILVIPTMLSKAELATAFPRAGGTYYIIDRSLGPLMGSIGGFGSWFSLVFKSAFALIGMGAYIAIFFDVPITPIAVILSLAFGALNIFGAKETSTLQNILVITLLSIMAFYLVQGFSHLFSIGILDVHREQFTPFFTNGFQGFFGTVGMVFVSYAGLTKVVSLAEEVEEPDRNIPRGMFISIIVAIMVYVSGVYLMTAVLEPQAFREDLTPVATAGDLFLNWLPGDTGLILVIIAAISAFASTGNAGIMSASRFPLAMSRDNLVHPIFSKIGRFSTPTISIVATTAVMILLMIVFNVDEVAKLASSFKLLLFGLLNLAVIVMRESQIQEYDPGYKSPFYPWIQILGMLVSLFLIFEMGRVSIIFTVSVTILSVTWYYYYAYSKIDRQGAIFHVHERLGQHKDSGLEREMRRILQEKGLREEDPYERAVARSFVLDLTGKDLSFDDVIGKVSAGISSRLELNIEELNDALSASAYEKAIQIGENIALKHLRLNIDSESEIALVRFRDGIQISKDQFEDTEDLEEGEDVTLNALIFLVSSANRSSQHLRMLAHLANMIDTTDFKTRWLNAKDETELREILLRDERFINITLQKDGKAGQMIGRKVKDLNLPGESLLTLIKRESRVIFPHGNTVLKENDELSIIGEKEDIDKLSKFK